ncbi:MAG TPA: Ig domain-containing protein [Kineosporiaceae bacterium]|nr:Ig domain-containing protein [Kineosporiaceae bacterium]
MLTVTSARTMSADRRRPVRWAALLLAGAVALVTGAGSVAVAPVARASAGQRLDLRVLVVDDGSGWVGAIAQTMAAEGVPFTDVKLADANRPTLTPGFLASGTEGYFQAVVLPDETGAGLSASEFSALRAYEAAFGVRQVDASTWANPAVGLNYAASPGYIGSLNGMTATVTASGQAQGFGYLSGNLPIAPGSYGFLALPMSATTASVMPAGGTFTPLVTVPIPGTASAGSLLGVYTLGGLSQLVITMNYNSGQQHFRMLAHGIISWMTQGIHFGYDRNNFTFHFDDAFSPDARWDSANNCTPGEDCPASVKATTDIRMTAADVAHVVAWEQASGYVPTLAFNGYYSQYDSNGALWNGTDALTNALVANKGAFRWLNHGYEHVYQGCTQDFTVIPWRCVTNPVGQAPAANGSNLVWTPQAVVSSEITQNIAVGRSLGLPFDPSEYLSGEHSGLFLTPQQPVDNPNFAAALSANGIKVIGADASREPSSRVVGGATTIPRHPTAVYYNTSTAAEAADEYNYFYLPAPAGKCVTTATTTCMSTPVDLATGFSTYIMPNDAAYDLSFILSNDPRPFYAHVSNLTGPDYLGLQLIDKILSTYNTSFAANAPLVNLTETQAADVLAKQVAWAAAGMTATPQVTGYLLDGQVTVTNPTAAAAPVTVPVGTAVNGTAFGTSYGGESSGWLPGSATPVVPTSIAPAFTSAGSAAFTVGAPGTFPVTTTGNPAAAVTLTGTLPAGVTFTAGANGTATLSGTPAAGTANSYPLTLTATNTLGSAVQAFTLTVGQKPAFTSAAATTFAAGTAGTFSIVTTGFPAATMTLAGALPAGVTFTANANGTATLAGTPAALTGKVYPLTVTAKNTGGTATQAFTLTVHQKPAFTSAATYNGRLLRAFSFTVSTSAYPAAQLSVSRLPLGISFRNNGNGTGTLSGLPLFRGTQVVTFTAKNSAGTTTQAFSLKIA